jgi:hypothetical protein
MIVKLLTIFRSEKERRLSPSFLIAMIATCAIVVATALSGCGVGASGGVVVSALSATACTEELGAEIIVAHMTRAIGGIAEAHRRITIHHF